MTGVPLRGRVAVAVLLAAAVTAACGGADAPGPNTAAGSTAAPVFVQADVDFVVHLSQHHSQALYMAELAASRARSDAVKRVAADIAATYAPDIDTLAGWIQSWGQAGAEMPAHGIEGEETGPGMLPERAVGRLESVRGQAFDREFRLLMTRHHRGGLQLVADQLQDGINADARALAQRLRAEKTDQLTQLK